MTSGGTDSPERRPVFVTGATGYIGGRLVPRLLERGYCVRCYARSAEKVRARSWGSHPNVEIVEGDLFDPDTDRLAEAMRGCGAAYYLVHAMLSAGVEYIERDREMARRFAGSATSAGLERIVYLGGLGELGEDLSRHLASRREVGQVLADGPVPVTELRAAMIIGSGSASFEILRYLTERLPVMITPRWVQTRCQPIAISNVIGYLIDCLDVPETAGWEIDIGGADVMPYEEILQVMAAELGLRRRLIIPVPVLTPRLSSLWIHLITPLSARIARPLAEGLRNEVVCRDDQAQRLMPQELLGVREAIHAAVEHIEHNQVETQWSMAGPIPGDPDWAGGATLIDARSIDIEASPAAVYRAVCRVGGGNGWYAADFLWQLRGWMDHMIGGPGLRRGRRNTEEVVFGEALDFWRVIGVEQDRRLELRAEMKLPGVASLEFLLAPGATPGAGGGGNRDDDGAGDDGSGNSSTRLQQTARFKPRGLFGILYWYSLMPLHRIVFAGMLKGIRRAALQSTRSAADRSPD